MQLYKLYKHFLRNLNRLDDTQKYLVMVWTKGINTDFKEIIGIRRATYWSIFNLHNSMEWYYPNSGQQFTSIAV